MSTVSDFNYIDDCDKIDSHCIDAYTDFELDPDNNTGICLHTPWGGNCLDLTEIVKNAESCTSLYLSPEPNPSCLVYEPEDKCGDNICVHGDDLSRIISMKYLKDVKQGENLSSGDVYMFNGNDNMFHVFSLQSFIDVTNNALTNLRNRMNTAEANISNLQIDVANLQAAVTALQSAVSALQATVANHESRIAAIEAILAKPTGAPDNVKLTWGTINLYSDPNAVIDSAGSVTSLDKTHGLYTHNLNTTAYGDEILG